MSLTDIVLIGASIGLAATTWRLWRRVRALDAFTEYLDTRLNVSVATLRERVEP